MAPARPGPGARLIRPLLTCRRAALRAHLKSAGRSWVSDPSNEDSRFERVRLRRRLAELEAEDAQLVSHLSALAADARDHAAVVEAAAAALGDGASAAALREAPRAVRRAALRRWAAARGVQASRAHLEALDALVVTGRGAVLLPGGREAALEDAALALRAGPERTRSTPRGDD